MNLKEVLNQKQEEAVKTTEGPVLVLAGAGSGKTRTLTYRVAYLIDQGVSPYNILTLTFTNKAAEDMTGKVENLIGELPGDLWLGTFHGVCVRILSRHLEELGYDSNFVIYDRTESESLVEDIILSFNLDKEKYEVAKVYAMINKAKRKLWSKEDFLDHYQEDEEGDFYQNIADIYLKYNEVLKDNNAFDFNDLLGKTIELFTDNPDILSDYQTRFEYILIDEYQDTSPAQYRLARLLAQKHNNIFAVGDDYQSIYKFRGADMENILNFNQDFEDATVIKLEQNYRCKENIIQASNAVIANNYSQFEKEAWTARNSGDPVIICEAEDEYSEAQYIVREIENLVKFGQYSYNDVAILYRSNHQSRVLEDEFIRNQIPYHIVGGLGFYDRKEIKDIISYLKVAINPQDTIALKRIVSTPKRGLGPKTIEKMITYAQEHVPEFNLLTLSEEDEESLGLFDVMEDPTQVDGIGNKTAREIKMFHDEIEEFITLADSDLALHEQVDRILKKSGYWAMLELDDSEMARKRKENLTEFLSLSRNYYEKDRSRDLEDFLRDLRLLSDQDDLEEANQVKMMTVHAAKGLEFEAVFVAGVEEEIFPHYRNLISGDLEDIEEERRLFYVAMTRASDRLFLTYSKQRKKFGEIKEMMGSRFLDEIPIECVIEKIHDGIRYK
ncbi:MAG: 3'-5' exonuclease [Halanaerobacter sp.]